MSATRLQQAFNAAMVPPDQGGGGGLPVGKHPVVIKGVEVTGNKAQTGGMAVFDIECLDGPAKGASAKLRLNLFNANADASRIAYQQLSALCHATQRMMIEDLAQLVGGHFVADVQLQRGEEAQQKGWTEIRKILDMAGNEPGKAPQQGQQQPAQGFQQQQSAQGFGGGQPAQGPNGFGQQQPQQQQPAQGQGGWQGGQQAPAQGQQPPAQGGGWGQQPQGGQAPAQGFQQQPQQQPQQPAQGGWQPNTGNAGAPQGNWGQAR